jgi:hypothetical protein
MRSEDETEIRAGEGTGGKGREGHPAGDPPAILGRRLDDGWLRLIQPA